MHFSVANIKDYMFKTLPQWYIHLKKERPESENAIRHAMIRMSNSTLPSRKYSTLKIYSILTKSMVHYVPR